MSSLIYKPKMFDLSVVSERHKLEKLVGRNPEFNILNELNLQIYEFIKLSYPSLVNNKKDVADKYYSFLKSINIEKDSNWIYYP